MATTYGKASWPIPSLTDAPNFPTAVQNIATQIDDYVIPRYASALAQTTAEALGSGVKDGDRWYRTDQSQGWINRNGTVVPDADSWNYIAATTLGTPTASVLLSGIPSTYRHLRVMISAKSPLNTNYYDNILMQINGSSSAIYATAMVFTDPPSNTGSVAGDSSSNSSAIVG